MIRDWNLATIFRNTYINRNLFHIFGRLKAELSVRFKESEFYALRRRKHYTETDIFSFVGGLLGDVLTKITINSCQLFLVLFLGLFLGFSVLSFVEIIYHFTFRICFKAKPTIEVQMHDNVSLIQRLNTIFNDYLGNSSIHGFNYVADKTKHPIERYEEETFNI